VWHYPHTAAAAAQLLLTTGPSAIHSISPGRRAHSSKPAAAVCGGQTDGRPTVA